MVYCGHIGSSTAHKRRGFTVKILAAAAIALALAALYAAGILPVIEQLAQALAGIA